MRRDQLEARRAHTRATLKAAAERRLAAGHPSVRRSVARPSRRVKNANPVPGVNVFDGWHGKGAALKGIKRPPRGSVFAIAGGVGSAALGSALDGATGGTRGGEVGGGDDARA